MQNNIETIFRYLLYLSCITVCLVWLHSRHETSQAKARAALQAVLDRDQLALEVDQLSARLEALIELEKAKLPIHHSHYMQSAPPAVFGSIEWQADIGIAAAYQFGLFDSGIAALKDTWTAAWGGIVASVMKGDLQTAIDIAWTAIQITFTQGFNSIKMGWRGVSTFVLDILDTIANIASKAVAVIVSDVNFLGKVFGIIFKNVFETAKNIAPKIIGIHKAIIKSALNVVQKIAQTIQGIHMRVAKMIVGIAKTVQKTTGESIDALKDLADIDDLDVKLPFLDEIKKARKESVDELKGVFGDFDDELANKIKGRHDANQAAFDADQARLDELKDRLNYLLAKANEPIVSPEAEKKLNSQLDKQQTMAKMLKNLSSGTSAISSRAIRAGQSLGDKTIKDIKGGIDKLGNLTETTNDLLEKQAIAGV